MLRLIFILSIFISFSFSEEGLLRKENNVYFSYIEDLIKNKNLTQEDIKKILNSNVRTIQSNMLKAIYADYYDNDLDKARAYYNEILEKATKNIKNTNEAIYISDFLLRENKYDIITEIITVDYCESLLNNKEFNCLYYLYNAKEKLNINNSKEDELLKIKYPKYNRGT